MDRLKSELKRVYQTPPTTRLPLPVSKHIKLAMTKEKGIRYGREADELMRHRVKGELEQVMASKELVDMDSIFNDGTFEKAHQPLVILVEGALGSGKTTLAHHYCHEWAKGNLTMFDLVALVYLHHPAVHSAGLNMSLEKLLLVASGNDDERDVRKVAHHVEEGLKFLLILEGWDEAPDCLRAPPDPKYHPDNSFLGKLLRSVSLKTTILITSRPDSSVDLHKRQNVERVEILGFTNESIHDYFREALSTQLSSDEVTVECSKLKKHFSRYPAIESSCYIPLNAAILTLVYLERNRTLPTTQYELLCELLLCCIDREVKTRQPNQGSESISSLDDLPHDLKEHLNNICKLAYEGIMQDKVVFSKQEISSFLPLPVQQDLPAMGVLQKVQWAGIRSKTMSYSFSHLSIQELLAAYCITKMEESEQVRVFQTLLGNPRFAAVLQFYAGFTKLTNQEIIAGTDFTSDKFSLLNYIRCFFEAQVDDRSLFLQILPKLNGKLNLSGVTMSPIDCVSVRYFLAFTEGLSANLSGCSMEHSFGFITGEPSSAGALLHRVTELNISYNKIGDKGAICIATCLGTDICTIRTLNVSNCGISDEGTESLARALAVNKSLQELDVSENEVARIAIALNTNTTLKTLNMRKCGITYEGAVSLTRALAENSSLQQLDVSDNNVSCIVTALESNTTLKTLNMRNCGIYSPLRAKSLAKLITVNKSLHQLNLSENCLDDNGAIAQIATALQTNTTLRVLDVSYCLIQVKSLASAIASLQELYIHENYMYDVEKIATAFRTNETLKTVSIGGKTTIDEDVMILLQALEENKSIECLSLLWGSTSAPYQTLLKIGHYVRTSSNLRRLYLYIARLAEVDRNQLLHNLTSGAQYLIIQLQNSSLQLLCLNLLDTQEDEVSDVRRALETIEATAATMNSARRSKGLPDIEVICCDQ